MQLGRHTLDFPLYLAPMAGVTDRIFRQFCKEQGADVLVTEFVSADGILHRNQRTAEYVEFDEVERPLGVQLFGAEPDRLAEAARHVIDWVQPDFLDINFGCPVNKVVCRNGGSALLRDCPLLEKVASAVVKAAAPVPVTAKIRIGWDAHSINATTTARLLEQCGVQAVAVHGRTKEQGYSGQANWEVIADVARSVAIPVIGNGDIQCAADVVRHKETTGVAGVMIGRAAMVSPWIFAEIKTYLRTGALPPPPSVQTRWEWIRRHCALTVASWGREDRAMSSMRSRLMAYSRALPGGKLLRSQFSTVSTLAELDGIAERHMASLSPEEALAA
jgi:tRNA-dihydrouridine synthase B